MTGEAHDPFLRRVLANLIPEILGTTIDPLSHDPLFVGISYPPAGLWEGPKGRSPSALFCNLHDNESMALHVISRL